MHSFGNFSKANERQISLPNKVIFLGKGILQNNAYSEVHPICNYVLKRVRICKIQIFRFTQDLIVQ